jgi:hypothetical protein
MDTENIYRKIIFKIFLNRYAKINLQDIIRQISDKEKVVVNFFVKDNLNLQSLQELINESCINDEVNNFLFLFLTF